MFNQEWENHGKPRTHLVRPIIAILNDLGYNVRFRECETDKHDPLYEFKIVAQTGDGLSDEETLYVKATSFSRAKSKAVGMFQDDVTNRMKKEGRGHRLARMTAISYGKYKLVDCGKEWIDDEESSF